MKESVDFIPVHYFRHISRNIAEEGGGHSSGMNGISNS